MSARVFALAAAVGCSAFVAFEVAAVAKDDPAAIKIARDAVRKDLAAKKMHPTADLSYVVDTNKLKDQRWEIKDLPEPADPWQGLMFEATFPSGNQTDPAPSIDFLVQKCVQQKTEGGKTQPFAREFKACGKNVKLADVEGLVSACYEEFLATATDPIKDKCKPTTKCSVGPAKLWATAVATDKEAKKRVRMDWYAWAASTKVGTFTWTVTVTTSERFIDNKDWPDKVEELLKNFKELNDPRLK